MAVPRRFGRRKAPPPIVAEPQKVYKSADGRVSMTRNQLNRLMWEKGLLFGLLRPHQEPVYDVIWNTPQHSMRVILCHRQFGKSHLVQLIADEKARRKPGWIGCLFLPQKAQAKHVLRDNSVHLYETCPLDLRPQDFTDSESCYVWPNGSRLYLAGTDDADQRERLRGQHADDIFIDEAGSHKELQYLVKSIIGPMTDTTRGRIVMVTTLPNHPEHEFMEFHDQAERNGTLFRASIDQNTFYTEEDKLSICRRENPEATEAELSGILSGAKPGNAHWEREYKLTMISDPGARVCPEFFKTKHVVQEEAVPRPAYCDRYVMMDQGHAPDFFAILFAEFDFSSGKLYVLDEWMGRHKNTPEIVAAAQEIEMELWGLGEEKLWVHRVPQSGPTAPRRYADDPRGQQQLADMAAAPYFYHVIQAEKSLGDVEQSREVRYRVHAGQIIISSKCKNLINQTAGGVFKMKDNGKAEFERSKAHGHLDCFSALAVGARAINWNHNSIPQGEVQRNQNTIVLPRAEKPITKTAKMVKSVFRGAFGGY